jgi:dTDP-4-dehydrorhamnose reductase
MAIDSRPRILVLGASGQIGTALRCAILGDSAFELIAATSTGSLGYDKSCLPIDLRDIENLALRIADACPDIVINASAYTNVELAEDEQTTSDLVNSVAVRIIGEIAGNRNIPVVHYSTDYVYEGSGDLPQGEHSKVLPASIYAQSKLRGEQGLTSENSKHLIFRATWIYSPEGNNFPRTILRHATTKNELRVVNDQIGAPTSARAVALATLAAVKAIQQPGFNAWGTYNLACRGYCSWFDFAEFIVKTAKAQGYELAVNRILPVPTSEYPTKAKRPLNSRLDISKFESQFNFQMPHWRDEFIANAPAMFEHLALPRPAQG